MIVIQNNVISEKKSRSYESTDEKVSLTTLISANGRIVKRE